jgi:hypothetical protein
MAYLKIRLEGLRRTSKIIYQCSWCPSQDFYVHFLGVSKKYYHLSN